MVTIKSLVAEWIVVGVELVKQLLSTTCKGDKLPIIISRKYDSPDYGGQLNLPQKEIC